MDEISKQFVGGILTGSGVIGVLAAYSWHGTIKRLVKCEDRCDENHDAITTASGRIDGLELVCNERHKRRR